ncbi:MAG: enediyne biosynthesis protein UnbU [Bacteroidetes bacterium]|nr:enediyne biosynthesis protein UnbU [Bacteroidota bacterium]
MSPHSNEKPALPRSTSGALRKAALYRFGTAITILNIVGRLWLGFEQSWLQLCVALAAAYATEIILNAADLFIVRDGRGRWFGARPMRSAARNVVDFLLPAHITAMAISMLLYGASNTAVFVFASVVAIAGKRLLRLPENRGARHILNPSNFGITVSLLAFPSIVAIAPPYHFTENLNDAGRVLLPLLFVLVGTFLNLRFTKRGPLIAGWVLGFVIQALVRALAVGHPITASLLPMSGVAFWLFTFYMITDPATTPASALHQILFGFGVAALYGVLVLANVVFGMFFALTIVCVVRWGVITVGNLRLGNVRAAADVATDLAGGMAKETLSIVQNTASAGGDGQ